MLKRARLSQASSPKLRGTGNPKLLVPQSFWVAATRGLFLVMARPKKPKEQTDEQKAEAHAQAEHTILSPDEYRLIHAGTVWGHGSTDHNLTVEEALFVHSYVIDRNPVAALRRINHEGTVDQLKRRAAKYLANAEVAAAVDELAKRVMSRLTVTAEKVNERIAAVAFFDPREVIEADHLGVRMLNTRFWRQDQAFAISSIEMGQHGIKIKLHDGLRAAEMLGKQLGTIGDETAEAAAAAAKAAAGAVVDRIMDIFERTVPDDPPPGQEAQSDRALPAPETQH